MAQVYDDRYSNSENATRFIKQRVADIAPTLDHIEDSPTDGKNHRIVPALWTSILAGGIAGVVVDISLYPLDTIKTRLQSKDGFGAAGGFKGVYKGILPVLLGSAPISALFFATYNTIINSLRTDNAATYPFVYLLAASAAEVICASVRVPIEVVKQRKQTSNTTSGFIIRKIIQKEGLPGFYRGLWSTLMREIPFAAIQYPLWEYMINQVIIKQHGKALTPLQTAYCGAAAGAVAAALTTPMDVVKTRIMLEEKEKIECLKPHVNYNLAKEIYQTRGMRGLFAGVVPRVLWIMLGGFVYFGAYDKAKLIWESDWNLLSTKSQPVDLRTPSYCDESLKTFKFSKDGSCQIIKPEDALEEEAKLPEEESVEPSDSILTSE